MISENLLTNHWFTGSELVFNFPTSSHDSAHFSFEKSKTKSSVFVSEILQNVTTGKHRQCGDSDSPILIEQFTDAHSGLGGVQGESSHTVDLRIELQVSDSCVEVTVASGECRGRAVTR
jgi:hypothetical protein